MIRSVARLIGSTTTNILPSDPNIVPAAVVDPLPLTAIPLSENSAAGIGIEFSSRGIERSHRAGLNFSITEVPEAEIMPNISERQSVQLDLGDSIERAIQSQLLEGIAGFLCCSSFSMFICCVCSVALPLDLFHNIWSITTKALLPVEAAINQLPIIESTPEMLSKYRTGRNQIEYLMIADIVVLGLTIIGGPHAISKKKESHNRAGELIGLAKLGLCIATIVIGRQIRDIHSSTLTDFGQNLVALNGTGTWGIMESALHNNSNSSNINLAQQARNFQNAMSHNEWMLDLIWIEPIVYLSCLPLLCICCLGSGIWFVANNQPN